MPWKGGAGEVKALSRLASVPAAGSPTSETPSSLFSYCGGARSTRAAVLSILLPAVNLPAAMVFLSVCMPPCITLLLLNGTNCFALSRLPKSSSSPPSTTWASIECRSLGYMLTASMNDGCTGCKDDMCALALACRISIEASTFFSLLTFS